VESQTGARALAAEVGRFVTRCYTVIMGPKVREASACESPFGKRREGKRRPKESWY